MSKQATDEQDKFERLLLEHPPAGAENLELVEWDGFAPSDRDFRARSCCFCCESSQFIEALYQGGDDYVIKRMGVRDDGRWPSYSHDVLLDGEHPYSGFRQVIGTDPEHPYYRFLLTMLERDGAFRSKLDELRADQGDDEGAQWNEFYMVLNELEDRSRRR